jgi:two-component system cell cycle sensor histidine kinase/response regulator CckA
MGYKVLTARCGKEALGMSGSETFDRLPKMSSGIRVLLSSCYSLSAEARKLMKGGCDGFIQKPFNMKALSAKITEILEEGREERVPQP